jgi:hypothetical protein
MAQAAPKHPYSTVSAPTADRFGKVAAGGPIADLQRTLEERLLAADRPMAPTEGIEVTHRVSRLAGPALLITAYAGVALWWF